MAQPLPEEPADADRPADVPRADARPADQPRVPERNAAPEAANSTSPVDHRLYAPHSEGWAAHIKANWDKDYCFLKKTGEDFFHLLQNGEIYVQRGTEKYCLNCALKLHILTEDRLHWQHRPRHPPPQPLDDL
jgi:hypothetical protein